VSLFDRRHVRIAAETGLPIDARPCVTRRSRGQNRSNGPGVLCAKSLSPRCRGVDVERGSGKASIELNRCISDFAKTAQTKHESPFSELCQRSIFPIDWG